MSKSLKKSQKQNPARKQISVSVNPDVYEKLKRLAQLQKRSKSAVVNIFIDEGFSNLSSDLELEAKVFGAVKI